MGQFVLLRFAQRILFWLAIGTRNFQYISCGIRGLAHTHGLQLFGPARMSRVVGLGKMLSDLDCMD